MKFMPLLHLLAASSSRPKVGNTWFIDGYNVLGHKGTPKDATVLAQKLQPIRADSVILVFDGPKKKKNDDSTDDTTDNSIMTTTTITHNNFQNVVLGMGMSADEYILAEIKAMQQQHDKQHRRVHVVTADRQLRSYVLDMKPIVRSVVNPSTFWKRYLPRLCGMKLPRTPTTTMSSTSSTADANE